MKTQIIIAALFAATAGSVSALESVVTDQVSADERPAVIEIQHEFAALFPKLNEPRWAALRLIVQNDAIKLSGKGMTATIIARDESEASTVADTMHKFGATVDFATAIDAGAKLVTIKVYR